MSRKAYILTFDRDDMLNYKEIHDKIISLPDLTNWFHYIKSSYILITTAQSASILSGKIKPFMPDKRFLVVELNLNNRNGWLPNDAWDWIRKQTSRTN